MKLPDSKAEAFARLRKQAVESFMREDAPDGKIHPDFFSAIQSLESLLDPIDNTEKYLRLYGKTTCEWCNGEFIKTHPKSRFCSQACVNKYRSQVCNPPESRKKSSPSPTTPPTSK